MYHYGEENFYQQISLICFSLAKKGSLLSMTILCVGKVYIWSIHEKSPGIRCLYEEVLPLTGLGVAFDTFLKTFCPCSGVLQLCYTFYDKKNVFRSWTFFKLLSKHSHLFKEPEQINCCSISLARYEH